MPELPEKFTKKFTGRTMTMDEVTLKVETSMVGIYSLDGVSEGVFLELTRGYESASGHIPFDVAAELAFAILNTIEQVRQQNIRLKAGG